MVKIVVEWLCSGIFVFFQLIIVENIGQTSVPGCKFD